MEDLVLRLLLAALVGGLIGAEREIRTGLGLRTLMLISIGSAMFTIWSTNYPGEGGDPRRIAAAVVTGVGFLGAGMILRHQGGVYGLTTAATVWLVAALGMGIGIGEYLLVGIATVLVLAVLLAIPFFQQLTNARQTVTYEIVVPLSESRYEEFEALLKTHKLRLSNGMISKDSDGIRYSWKAYGKPDNHLNLMDQLLQAPEVIEVRAF